MERSKDITGEEYDWLGPRDETKHVVYRMQSADRSWFDCSNLQLEEHSEFTVMIHDPRLKSLSFIYRTLCVLPKSRLRAVYNLIGRYLNEHDSV